MKIYKKIFEDEIMEANRSITPVKFFVVDNYADQHGMSKARNRLDRCLSIENGRGLGKVVTAKKLPGEIYVITVKHGSIDIEGLQMRLFRDYGFSSSYNVKDLIKR